MIVSRMKKRWSNSKVNRQRKFFPNRAANIRNHYPLCVEALEVRQMLDTESFSATLPLTPTDFGPSILSLNQFDTQGGYRILDQIDLDISLQLDTDTSGSLTNTGTSQATYRAVVDGTGTASGPAIAGLSSIIHTDTGVIPVPGNSTVNIPPTSDSDPQTESHTFIDAINFALFTGLGTMDYTYNGSASTSITVGGGGNLIQSITIVTTGQGSAEVTYTFHLAAPAVNIVKLTNDTDNNSPTGPLLPIGSPVTWTYNVTNPGNVQLANVNVVDDQLGVTPVFVSGDTDGDNRLDTDETWVYTASGVATPGQYENTGTVTGNPVDADGNPIVNPNVPTEVTDDDLDHYFGQATVQTRISISVDGVNAVGQSHIFTAFLEIDDGLPANQFGGDAFDGFGPGDGELVTITLDGSNGAVPDISAPTDQAPADPSSESGLTDASGFFSVTFSSATAGKVAGNAYFTVVDTDPITAEPSDTSGGGGGSGPALKRFVDANITIAADGVNAVGESHTFTVTVNQDDGLNADEGGDGITGFAPVTGAAVTVNLDGTNGAIPDISAPTDQAPADPSSEIGVTNASGQFDVTFSSATAGKVSGNGYATFTLDGVNLERDTDPTTAGVGSGPNGSGPSLKRFVDANITIAADGVNAVGESHTFTVTVNQDDGLNADEGGDGVTGFAPVTGAAVTVNLDGTNGAIPDISAPTDQAPADPSSESGLTNASGQFDVTFSSATAGKVTGNGYVIFTLDGVNLVRDTDPTTINDGSGPNGSGPSLKRFVDANITIAADGTNPVGAPHTFTVTVNQNDGLNADEGGDGVTGFTPVSGADVTVNLDGSGAIPDISAPTDLPPADPSSISGLTDALGQFAVTFTSAIAGTVTGNGLATFTLDGVNLVRDTDPTTLGAVAGPNGSGPAIKTFIGQQGHTATIGFWHNKNGKAVILSSAGTNLSNWLATNFPNLYGSLAGATNLQVHNFFVSGTNSYFGSKGTKTNAQVLAVALAVYFTDVSNTAVAQSFGFGGSLGNTIVSINGNASAFAGYLEPGGTTISINNMLAAANFNAVGGVIFGGAGSNWKKVNDQFSFVNEAFDI